MYRGHRDEVVVVFVDAVEVDQQRLPGSERRLNEETQLLMEFLCVCVCEKAKCVGGGDEGRSGSG